MSNNLEVPGATIAQLGVPPPQTPRSTNTINPQFKGITPTFSFGLSFLPSFLFNSPLTSVSPNKFFNVTNNLSKAIKRLDPEDKTKSNIFTSESTPQYSSHANKFLDSLTKSHTSDEDQDHKDTINTQEDSVDMWSSLGGDSNVNQSNLTSIYEDEDFGKDKLDTFLTPNKFMLPIKLTQASESKLDSAVSMSIKDGSKALKKRKLSASSVQDSPNNSIASHIDSTIYSPVPNRQKSVSSLSNEPMSAVSASGGSRSFTNPISTSSTSLVNLGSDLGDKVWYPELDQVLIKSLFKYRDFRENHARYNSTSILKNTSQNKILSRMLFNKTGILRTSKQISSRLFRLVKSKKLDKSNMTSSMLENTIPTPNVQENSIGTTGTIHDEIEDLIQTPLESLISSASHMCSNQLDSIKTNQIIDHELDLLLSSPSNDHLHNCCYTLMPKEFKISFHQNNKLSNSMESHDFAQLHQVRNTSLTTKSLLDEHQHLNQRVIEKLKSENIPVWLVNHEMNLDINSPQLFTSTPISPFNQINPVQPQKSLNFLNGNFESFLKAEVNFSVANDDKSSFKPSLLSWKCLTQIYGDKSCTAMLLENVDIINGYYSTEHDNFNLQIPFMKNFFAGHLAFLINGSNNNQNLTVKQTIYNNNLDDFEVDSFNFNEEKSNIYGFLLHEFKFDNFSDLKGSTFTIVNFVDDHDKNTSLASFTSEPAPIDDKFDDNETVVADSSPFKSSPKSQHSNFKDSPYKRDLNSNNLKLNIEKNESNFTNQGPMSAPIYNSEIVHEFNQSILKQQERLSIHVNRQQELRQPVLNHSRSTGNIGTFKTTSSSPVFTSPDFQTKNAGAGTSPFDTSLMAFTPLPTSAPSMTANAMNLPSQFHQPAQPQLMVNMGNGYVPFNSLHPNLQKQYMLVHRQFEIQKQEQQKLYLQQFEKSSHLQGEVLNAQQFFPVQQQQQQQQQSQQQSQQSQQQSQQQHQQYFNSININSAPASQTQFNIPPDPQQPISNLNMQSIMQNQTQYYPQLTTLPQGTPLVTPMVKESNKENLKPKEIKFGPILEYDPSKDSKRIQQRKVSKHGTGIHSFPINTPVSMYKPKKK